jgi:hypothetical protein
MGLFNWETLLPEARSQARPHDQAEAQAEEGAGG